MLKKHKINQRATLWEQKSILQLLVPALLFMEEIFMKVIINTSKKYGTWLKGHLEKEHPKTKHHITTRKR